MKNKYIKWLLFLIGFILLAFVVVLYSLWVGEFDISLLSIPDILINKQDSVEYTVITQIRLPRILLGLAVGGALSLAGVLLQGIYRNPLVEPYTLGISGGAALGVSIVIVFGLQQIIGLFMLPLAGFIGAMVTIILVYVLSVKKGRLKMQSMLLIGVMISFISSSGMMFLMAISSSENIHSIIFWIMGSLDEPNMTLIYTTSIISALGLLVSYMFVQPLNALRLGEEKARHLGINTEWAIRLLFIIASLLTGVCVAVAGVIGFVGLVIPHLVRLLVGNDYRIFLIASFVVGGSFIVLSDAIARTVIAPNELPVGVITGIIGGTLFIVVLAKNSFKR